MTPRKAPLAWSAAEKNRARRMFLQRKRPDVIAAEMGCSVRLAVARLNEMGCYFRKRRGAAEHGGGTDLRDGRPKSAEAAFRAAMMRGAPAQRLPGMQVHVEQVVA